MLKTGAADSEASVDAKAFHARHFSADRFLMTKSL